MGSSGSKGEEEAQLQCGWIQAPYHQLHPVLPCSCESECISLHGRISAFRHWNSRHLNSMRLGGGEGDMGLHGSPNWNNEDLFGSRDRPMCVLLLQTWTCHWPALLVTANQLISMMVFFYPGDKTSSCHLDWTPWELRKKDPIVWSLHQSISDGWGCGHPSLCYRYYKRNGFKYIVLLVMNCQIWSDADKWHVCGAHQLPFQL